MKVWIDQDACVGNGICSELAPAVFEFDGEYAYVRDVEGAIRPSGVLVAVPAGLEEAVVASAEECPAACIFVEDD